MRRGWRESLWDWWHFVSAWLLFPILIWVYVLWRLKGGDDAV